MKARQYRYLREAVVHADKFRDRRPDLFIRIVLGVEHMTVSGEVAGTRHNLHSQVRWTDFDAATTNILIAHIDRVAMHLQPYAVDLAAQHQQ